MDYYNKNIGLILKDYNFNIRIIRFITIVMIFLLIFIHCIRVYREKKQNFMMLLHNETFNIQNSFSTNIYYSKYFLDFLFSDIKDNFLQETNVKEILHSYEKFLNSHSNIFGWHSYRLINKNFEEIIANNYTSEQQKTNYIKTLKTYTQLNQSNRLTSYYFFKDNDNFDLIYNVFSKPKYHHKCSVILSYDTNQFINKLKAILNEKHINFIIIDENLNIIIQSKPIIKNMLDNTGLSQSIKKILRQINFKEKPTQTFSYFSILQKENYYIKKIDGLPFITIINLDNNIIRQHIIKELSKKLIEFGLFGIILLLSLISIYKRESLLRNKAEKATIVANNATKAKSEFLAFTAHEIRSPLGFMLTGSEIMVKEILGPLPISYKAYAEGIHQNSKIILEFIKDILDENQIIEGRFRIVNSIINITEVIEESILLNTARFNNRNVYISKESQNNLPNLIADRRRVLQIMNNLISNAIKYSKDNTTVIIKSSLTNMGLLVEVQDHGIGMSTEQLNDILSTGDMTFKNNDDIIESYGLGLLIVKMLIEAHDAKLTIKSIAGSGTTVTIIFPEYKLIYSELPKLELVVID